jgi:hypothetical protein
MNTQSTHNKKLFFVALSLLIIAAILGGGMSLPAYAADAVDPIEPGPETVLPDYIGAPAKAQPLANSRVPQDPFLAPNPFSQVHSDAWNSDVTDFAGPLGRDPEVLSSALVEARRNPNSLLFNSPTRGFDSHGRPVMVSLGPEEASVVLADADTLQALSWYHVEVPPDRIRGLSAGYFYVNNLDQTVVVSGTHTILILGEGGSETQPVFELVNTYDLSKIDPPPVPGDDRIGGMMPDWQGRIWFDTAGEGIAPANMCVLNPATYPHVKCVTLDKGKRIRNTFALTKSGMDRSAAYVVTSTHMYRVEAGPDDQPKVVWDEPYDTSYDDKYGHGRPRPGQYEVGSGTSPTILGNGKYVAINDDAMHMQVVVFRTDEQLDPNEERKVCEVEVFTPEGASEEDVYGANSNSLIGSGLSLIAGNNAGYSFNLETQAMTPSLPGHERIDIDPNGRGCTKIWSNNDVASIVSPHLSTKTGLIYTVTRKMDTSQVDAQHPYGLDVYYWTALDFRTGEVVWQKMAGTGWRFDGWYLGLGIGPTGTLYAGVYGGLAAMRDSR